jgi:rare lipoprotein A
MISPTRPGLLGNGLPRGLVWQLLPWRTARRAAMLVLVLLATVVGALRLTEGDAEALPFVQGGGRASITALPPAALSPALEAPAAPTVPGLQLSPQLAAGAAVLLPQLPAITGEASFYARMLEGRPTASGETYRGDRYTAAHRSLPFGTLLRVTNLANGRRVDVRVNDRGPFHRRRILDLSRAAAAELGMLRRGHAKVQVEVLAARR